MRVVAEGSLALPSPAGVVEKTATLVSRGRFRVKRQRRDALHRAVGVNRPVRHF